MRYLFCCRTTAVKWWLDFESFFEGLSEIVTVQICTCYIGIIRITNLIVQISWSQLTLCLKYCTILRPFVLRQYQFGFQMLELKKPGQMNQKLFETLPRQFFFKKVMFLKIAQKSQIFGLFLKIAQKSPIFGLFLQLNCHQELSKIAQNIFLVTNWHFPLAERINTQQFSRYDVYLKS